ncbi:hypothetical protein AAZX31_12G144000 [Glycine max]
MLRASCVIEAASFNLVFDLLCCSSVSVLIGIFRFLTDYKNFYPKEKKEVPKRNDKKHEYKGYEDVGDFIVSERLETGVHVNLIFYLIIGSIGLF